MNDTQKRYLSLLWHHKQIIAVGPPGTGKTFLAARTAAQKLYERRVSKIILTRPMVATEKMGFLPGTVEEKYGPWAYPLIEPIQDYLGESHFKNCLKNNVIELTPLAFMRGRNMKDAYIILDEAQNTTYDQIKMFLTRIGEGSTVVVTGDLSQTDLREGSGLYHVKRIVQSSAKLLEKAPIVEFNSSEIVRSETTALWHEAFEEYESLGVRRPIHREAA